VLEAIRELGYSPDLSARNLIRRKNPARRVGRGLRFAIVLRPEVRKFEESYFAGVLGGIEEQIRQDGHCLAFCDSYENLEANPVMMNSLLAADSVDGILTFVGTDKALVFDHLAATAPLVHLDHIEGHDCVCPDKAGAMSMAVAYLAGLGHRNIGFMGGTAKNGEGVYDRRFSGFIAEMDAHGLPLRREWCRGGKFGFDVGKQAAKDLLSLPERPTAVFCTSDITAIGAMHTFLDAGLRIPEDMSVMGFDNTRESWLFHPPLTTIDANMDGVGRMAVRHLVEKLANPALPPRYLLVPVRLVERRTCAPPSPKARRR
jgi:DNA-binding LacI/PurR family transcriptional regulator